MVFKTFVVSAGRRNATAKFSLYFYVLFAGLLILADASHKGDYWQMAFGLAAVPMAVVLRSFLGRMPGKRLRFARSLPGVKISI